MPETYGLSPIKYLEKTQGETIEIQTSFLKEFGDALVKAAEATASRIKSGGKLLIIGNGGSAADAQHIAAEMIGRMLVERHPLPAIALTTDTSNLTAVGNDYGYDQVFLRQVKGLCKPNDVLLAISTSGNSQNVLLATEEAKRIGAYTVGLTGGSGGKLAGMCDVSLIARLGKSSSRIQETHIFALHSYVDLMDRFFLDL